MLKNLLKINVNTSNISPAKLIVLIKLIKTEINRLREITNITIYFYIKRSKEQTTTLEILFIDSCYSFVCTSHNSATISTVLSEYIESIFTQKQIIDIEYYPYSL
jgi:hypothetical protein